jgi:prepilin-type N-terminal cleavage/methylation domain-containing protein
MSPSQTRIKKGRHSAFTLIEVMVAVVLLGIVMATVGPNFRRTSASTKGAALALAAALTEARQQAITQQLPVALVIPSDNGAQGQANSYFIAAGEQPRVTKVKRLSGEQSDLRLMVGHWPLDTSKLKDPTLTTTVTPPPEATWENDFDLNLWGLPAPKDYAFVFTPRGKLVSNDLPHFDGAYHIVVSHGGSSIAATAPGTGVMTTQPTLFGLTQVGSPYTVTIDPAGSVSVTPGLIAVTAGGVDIKGQAALLAPPNPPTQSPPPSTAPVVTSVTLLPDPTKLEPPAGVDMLLAADRHLTMTVRARSPEGAPLFCIWTATDGGLSAPEQVRATYLPQTQEWESVWHWRFPTGTDPGEQFTVEGVVKDSYGNETPVGLGAGADPFVVEAGVLTRILFWSNRALISNDIYVMNTDGTGLTNLTDDIQTGPYPVEWSPDGSRIAFTSDRDGNREVYVMNADGTALTNLTNNPGDDYSPTWSPDGSRIAFYSERDGNSEVYVMNADGTALTNLSNHPGFDEFPAWSPDGSRIAFTSDRDGANSEVYVINADGTALTNLTNDPQTEYFPLWSPDGSRIAFTGDRNGYSDVFVMNADGTGQTNLTNSPGYEQQLAWSPDGSRIACHCDRSLVGFAGLEIYVVNADGTGETRLTNSPGYDFYPDWLPDGRIAFCSGRDGNPEIYVVNADGTALTNLTKKLGDDIEPRIR